jgi:drug/metabolite transporter (DMT)-like permease
LILAKSSIARLLLLTIPICVWAISWPVMKIGVTAIPPIWFGCLRYCIGFSCLAVMIGVRGRFFIPSRQDWPLVLTSGALQMAAFSALTGLALTIIPPGRASILAYSTPLWVVPFAAWRFKETLSRKTFTGLAFGLLGIGVIAAPSVHGKRAELVGYGMLLAAAAFWAVSILYVRAHRFVGTALELAPWQMLVASLLLAPVAVLTEGWLPAIDKAGAMSLAFVGPIATGLAYWAIVEAGRHFHASTISIALLATPVLGVLISVASLGETINLGLIGGMTLIGGGICLATVKSGDADCTLVEHILR